MKTPSRWAWCGTKGRSCTSGTSAASRRSMYVSAVGPDPPPCPLHSAPGGSTSPLTFCSFILFLSPFSLPASSVLPFFSLSREDKWADQNGNWEAGFVELRLFLAGSKALFRRGLRIAVGCLSSWYFLPQLYQPPFLGSSGRILPKWPFALPVICVYPRNCRPSGIMKGIQVAQTPCAECAEHKVPLHSAVQSGLPSHRVAAFPAGNTLVSPLASEIIQFGPFTLSFQKLSPEGLSDRPVPCVRACVYIVYLYEYVYVVRMQSSWVSSSTPSYFFCQIHR